MRLGTRRAAGAHRQHAVSVRAAFTLVSPDGSKKTYEKAQCTVGSGASCDIRISGKQVADSHALLLQKGKQTFLKPLLGESLLDPSLCWKDGVALRPGVSYVLASGSSIAFGEESQAYKIEFDEGTGSNPMVEFMMKGMLARSGNDEVKKALGM